jgi:hypothetical protein
MNACVSELLLSLEVFGLKVCMHFSFIERFVEVNMKEHKYAYLFLQLDRWKEI